MTRFPKSLSGGNCNLEVGLQLVEYTCVHEHDMKKLLFRILAI